MKPSWIIIHHSASPQYQTAQEIDNYHKSLWNFKSKLGHFSGYQYIIEQDGTVFQARKDTEIGAHCKEGNMNYKSIGICVVGWYDDGHDYLPTKAQQNSLGKLLRKKMNEYDIGRSAIKFHRDFAPKSCPGYHITQDFITNLIKTMNKDFIEIIEKITDENLGDNINVEKEQPRVAKKLKEFYEESNNLKNDYESFKLETKNNIEKLKTKIINQADMIKAKDIQIEKLKEENINVEDKTITQLLGIIISKILKSNGTN